MPDELIGTVVAERFLVEHLIGQGGMGKVYQATHLDLERRVALKLLYLKGRAVTHEHQERFLREARMASRIAHPNLALIYDFGRWDGQLYLAMELLDGESLAAPLERAERLSQERAARILAQVAGAVHEAHGAGVLHRDLKPENVMLTTGPDGEELVKVVDFGLALLLDSDEERLTRDGMVSGTPAYMSPEQCRGKKRKVDGRADVYAMGIMLYELLCNRLPFTADNAHDVLVQQMFKEPRPPSDREPGLVIHPALEALALWAMSKEPANRPRSAAAFKLELENALALMEQEGAPAAPEPYVVPGLDAGAPVIVFEADEGLFTRSATAALRANDVHVRTLDLPADAGQLLQVPEAEVVIIDLRSDVDGILARLEPVLADRPKGALPFTVAVGPGDEIELMARAIGLGFSDYVPEAALGSRLPKVTKRLQKRASKARK